MRAQQIALLLLAAACAPGCSVDRKVPLSDGVLDAPAMDAPPDDGAPETMLTAAPDKFSRIGASTFRFTSDDASATFECSIDGDTPIACQAPYTRTLGDGPHTFSVRAIDRAGNRDKTPAEHVWTIDTVAPDTMIVSTPPAADNSSTVRFEFRSNEQNTTFECSLDSGAYAACTSGSMFGPVGDGAHAFAVRARDRAGNVDSSPAIYAWLVDTSTPDTVLLSGPSGSVASTSATFTFLSPDAGPGATFQCSLDGAAYVACTSPRDVAGLGEGAHAFAVRVRTAAGTLDPTPATRAWIVDLTPPDTAITSGPSGLEPVASASFTFSSSEADSTFACSLDGAPFASCTSPFTAAGLAQSGHIFAVRAIDAAGHPDPTPATRTWSVDTIPPDVMIASGPASGGTSGPRVWFTFSASDGALACSLDGAAFAACTSPAAFNLPAGGHELRVRATDAAGNTATVARAWTVVCAAPDAAGAAALLHLDDTGQVLANAVPGGAPAMLGDDLTDEPIDPTPAQGRFGGGLAFSAAQGDRAAWPLGLAAAPALAIELWVNPQAASGARDLLVSGDARLAIRATAFGASNVRISATAVDGSGGQAFTATSGNAAAGAWHHVLVSLQEPVLRLWVDGVRAEVGGVSLGGSPELAAVRLGGNYDGLLDEVWIEQAGIADDEAALSRYCPP
jgi:concanavalin A-like lectin/glucanase superfamily protein